MIARLAETVLPTEHATFRAFGYRDSATGLEHMALVLGDLADGDGGEGVLVRVHSECLTGDAFGSARCDCGPQLRAAVDMIAAAGVGVVVYLRGHEGRGIGLVDKLRAYALQDRGADTVDANLLLGLPSDSRDFGAAVAILRDLGVQRVRALTNNPAKTEALRFGGVDVRAQVPLLTRVTPENVVYLRTKVHRLGHAPALAPVEWREGGRA